MSSGTWVRIPRTENPRFPEEGSSALGKSGPKARPKGVVDGQQVEIPVPVSVSYTHLTLPTTPYV